MHRNVPKYFAPIGASEMLITNPARLISKAAKRKGDRILTRSDHMANIMSMITGNAINEALRMCVHVKHAPAETYGGMVSS